MARDGRPQRSRRSFHKLRSRCNSPVLARLIMAAKYPPCAAGKMLLRLGRDDRERHGSDLPADGAARISPEGLRYSQFVAQLASCGVDDVVPIGEILRDMGG